MKKKTKVVLVVLIAIGIIISGGYLTITKITQNYTNKINIDNIDISKINDGNYEGNYSANPVSASVNVSVKDHQITNIELIEHQTGLGGKAKNVINDVINKQSTDVDTINGATLSSKVILKAIEYALTKGSN